MGDITSTRPASGAPIATAWGAEIHDAIEGIQTGMIAALNYGSTGSPVDTLITFPRPYATPPVVIAGSQSGAVVVGARLITATGFTMAASRPTYAQTGTVGAQWIAIGTPA